TAHIHEHARPQYVAPERLPIAAQGRLVLGAACVIVVDGLRESRRGELFVAGDVRRTYALLLAVDSHTRLRQCAAAGSTTCSERTGWCPNTCTTRTASSSATAPSPIERPIHTPSGPWS